MFVCCVKSKMLKRIGVALLAAVFVTVGAVYYVNAKRSAPVSRVDGISMKASTAQERIDFLSQFGWEINEDPCQVKEVVIPTEFDEVYQNYNEIQKKQGLDLEKYKGAKVKMWSYEVLNYPGYEQKPGVVTANMLVFENVIIGGDVSSTELGGFMHGFDFPQNSESS